MRKVLVPLTLLSLTMSLAPAWARDLTVNVIVGEREKRDLYVASESYFGVSQQQTLQMEQRGIAAAELPVVLFLASKARVEPSAVAELRLGGRSWMDIAQHYRLGAEAFYVPVVRAQGPYEVTYRHYQSTPRDRWNTIRLSDEDVSNLVYLKFMTEHYGWEPERVIDLRAGGRDFFSIHREIRGGYEIRAEDSQEFGVDLEEEYQDEFYAEAEAHYQIPQAQFTVVRQRHLPEAELPVALFLATQARVEPSLVVDMRLRGMTWMEITRRFNLGADIFYVPVQDTSLVLNARPYSRAYGFYTKRPRAEWRSIMLHDDDVINLVNLRFVSERYNRSPDAVIRLRTEGRPMTHIYREVIVEKRGKSNTHVNIHVKGGDDKSKAQGKGKGKGKEKGKGGKGKKDKGKGKGKNKGKD